MKRFAPILTALTLVVVVLAAGPAVSAKDNWTSVRSRNFHLIGNASEKEIRQVATRLEQFREVFTRLFPTIKFTSPVPTTVIVFKSENSYAPFRPNANTAGYFQPGPDVNYITLTTEVRGEQDPFSVIFHEYTHLLVNGTLGNAPLWFNEGLAEYYSSFSISDDRKVMLGKPISHHVYLLRDSKMLPLPTLFKVDHDSPHYNEGQKQSIFYAQSWALMHYLIHRPGGSAAIDKFMKLTSGDTPMDQAFQQSFDTTFEKMEKELRGYIKHDSYPVTAGRFENKITFDSELKVAEVSEAEANAYLGDLLLHSHRADSEKYLQKALTLDANQAMANTSLAMLRVREGKIDEARSSLERAVAANSQNYLVHYYYAFALSRQGMNDSNLVSGYSKENLARMRAELKKAIELRPDFPESYGLLAFINLVDGNELDQSIALLKKILEVSPGRNDLTFTLAQIYLVKEDFKSSRELLERLSQNQSDSAGRRQAKNLLASLENRETSIASYRNAKDGNGGAAGGAPRLKRRDQSSAEETAEEVQVEMDPFIYLREAMRQPAADEKQLQGMLLRLECDPKGVIFIVQVGDRLMKLRTTQFENIQITSFTTDAAGEITCGARKPQNVVVTFVLNTDPKAKLDGQLRSVEFVPEEFKLKN